MTHHIAPEGDARPKSAHEHSARAQAPNDDAVLDHHVEELLSALGDLDLLRGDTSRENGG